jgi:hypothetical protein
MLRVLIKLMQLWKVQATPRVHTAARAAGAMTVVTNAAGAARLKNAESYNENAESYNGKQSIECCNALSWTFTRSLQLLNRPGWLISRMHIESFHY